MAKLKTAHFCQNCGHESAKWLGRCPSCNEWNTFVEEVISKGKNEVTAFAKSSKRTAKPQAIHQIKDIPQQRIQMVDLELNRVLGGGLVPGSLTLFGGEPGIGKSTLMLQLPRQEKNKKIKRNSQARNSKVRFEIEPWVGGRFISWLVEVIWR